MTMRRQPNDRLPPKLTREQLREDLVLRYLKLHSKKLDRLIDDMRNLKNEVAVLKRFGPRREISHAAFMAAIKRALLSMQADAAECGHESVQQSDTRSGHKK